jgi:DNA-binding CsgD family transcriptional regulator
MWFVLLYTAIFLCNLGYFLLSISQNVEDALLANRISYLGAAYLPLIMLAIIADICVLRYSKTLGWTLFGISTAAFLLAASGGIFPIYYKEAAIRTEDGITQLVKVYGPLHFAYSLYLFAFFATMIVVIIRSIAQHKLTTYRQAATLVALVFVNIGVWFIEQFIHEKFEFLAVSYVVTGLFILLANLMLQDYELHLLQAQSVNQPDQTLPKDVALLFDEFAQKAASLTASEKNILKYYAEGLDVQETAEKAFISIHTVRKHNANIYQKLSVSSRDELMLYIDLFRRCNRLHELLP